MTSTSDARRLAEHLDERLSEVRTAVADIREGRDPRPLGDALDAVEDEVGRISEGVYQLVALVG